MDPATGSNYIRDAAGNRSDWRRRDLPPPKMDWLGHKLRCLGFGRPLPQRLCRQPDLPTVARCAHHIGRADGERGWTPYFVFVEFSNIGSAKFSGGLSLPAAVPFRRGG
jgi:hypothetical protein